MSWLDDTEQHRKRQVALLAKTFGGNDIQKATDNGVSEDKEKKPKKKATPYGDKSDMYKMKMLKLRNFNEQDQKSYIGVEDVENSYITNQENGDIVISKTTDGYLVSKFPIDAENEEGEEKTVTTLSEAIDVALQYKDDLDNAKAPEQIMYKETEDSDNDDDSEKGFDDEINPFERAAWEAEQDELRKAYETLGFDYNNIEKAKHQDGDMHPNGKWVWRQSANGGKGDWRVAKPGGSKTATLNDKIINSQSAAAAKAYVRFLNSGNDEMSFNNHFAEALERANGDTNKVLKVFKEHLKKHLMSAGVAPESVDSYYKQFQDDLDKIAIKNYLKKKGIEWQLDKGKTTNTSKKKVTLKQIFEDVQGLNPSTSTISSLGTFVSVQNQQLADNKARVLMGYLPKDSLASKIIVSTKGRFTDKQLWVIAYELEKNDKYKDALSDILEDIERKERLKKESKKKEKTS